MSDFLYVIFCRYTDFSFVRGGELLMGKLCDADYDKIVRGKRLQKYREKWGYSQNKLAEHVHVVRETISRYESGQMDMKAEPLKRICEDLQVSADILLGLAPDPLPDDDSEETEDEASDNFARVASAPGSEAEIPQVYFCLTPEHRAVIHELMFFYYDRQCHGQ